MLAISPKMFQVSEVAASQAENEASTSKSAIADGMARDDIVTESRRATWNYLLIGAGGQAFGTRNGVTE